MHLPPYGVTTNEQLDRSARRLRIPFFRGVFMRDALPTRVRCAECGIVNLDDAVGPGTHWVAYAKKGNVVIYFDAFGNLRPPRELARYLGESAIVTYNRRAFQTFDQRICGQLCLRFLREIDWGSGGRFSRDVADAHVDRNQQRSHGESLSRFGSERWRI